MRTVFQPDTLQHETPERVYVLAARQWDTRYETTLLRDNSPLGSVSISCDGSACQEGSGYGWYEETSGSWSAGGSTSNIHGYAQYTESHAILTALQTFHMIPHIRLYSDCFNVVEAFRRLQEGVRVKTQAHRDTWLQELYLASLIAREQHVEIMWVKSHSTHLGNRIADKLANWGRKAAIRHQHLDTEFIEGNIDDLRRRASFSSPKEQ